MNSSVPSSVAPSEEVVACLRKHGITPTQPRIEIGRVLFSGPQHVSADQVLARLSTSRRGVSKATVYNTLGLFAEKGLLREVVVDPSKLFYDTNVSPHHHVFHTDTGRLEDVPVDQVHVTALPNLPEGVRMEGVDVVIRVSRAEA
jgi:Fur family iron response transcriptional regulator